MLKKKYSRFIILIFTILVISVLIFCNSRNENQQFTRYTQRLFCQEACTDSISLHYTLKSPSSYEIQKDPLTLGQFHTDISTCGLLAENALEKLYSYNRMCLSDENRLVYDLLEHALLLSKEKATYTLYYEPLRPLTGIQTQLPVLLSEYKFYTEKDVITYLLLLKDFPSYFQSLIDFEKAKSENGLFMADKQAENIIEECDAFLSCQKNHFLSVTFENRLKTLDLPEKKFHSYMEANHTHLAKYVFPSYESLKKELTSLLHTGKNQKGLTYLPKGKSYYEILVKDVTGSAHSISKLKIMASKQIQKDLSDMNKILASPLSRTDYSFEKTEPVLMLDDLKNKLKGLFPEPPDVNYSVNYVDSSMEEYLSPAFYLIPPIDTIDENTIYINPGHISDDLTLFTTLAHEGYPGHLYQTTYFTAQKNHPLRYLLSCGGYVEGWATYCEMMSYYFSPLSHTDAALMQKNSSVMLGLYALTDIGIHYDGWSLKDTIKFFDEYGIHDKNAITEIYDLIIGSPANYLKYYIGYLEFLDLKCDAIESWGKSFSQERFHQEILKTGPVPFQILRKQLGLSH